MFRSFACMEPGSNIDRYDGQNLKKESCILKQSSLIGFSWKGESWVRQIQGYS